MPFRIDARTILQLGEELISSDAIAFYELIKNAFDAGSERVDINVVIRIPYADVETARSALQAIDRLQERDEEALEQVTRNLAQKVLPGLPEAATLRRAISAARSTGAVRDLLRDANFITFSDSGEGMSLDDLDRVFLMIGTRKRLEEREERKRTSGGHPRPILGEKGVGRLSAMRLGDHLLVRSTRSGEPAWNVLDIDWSLFSLESEVLLDSVDIAPHRGDRKQDPTVAGTVLRVAGLKSEWSAKRVREEVVREIGRYLDPFADREVFRVRLRFNGDLVTIPRIDKLVFEQAHAVVRARFEVEEELDPQLTGQVNYRLRSRERTFQQSGTDLLSIIQPESERALRSLGPFRVTFYWFNRKLLRAVEAIGDKELVKGLVNEWGGGIAVYRDGFRVNPYGGPNDDWLDLDRRALASGGYKVNRAQIIGALEITGENNPQLRDQTNREGLQETPEFRALRRLLQHIVRTEFKTFMEAVDKERLTSPLLDLSELEERVEAQEATVAEALTLLRARHPEIDELDPEVLTTIERAAQQIRTLLRQAYELAEQYDARQSELIHLAGLGLMVELLAHELARTTTQTLRTLDDLVEEVPPNVARMLSTLQAQMKTLQKRVRVMDPLSTAARQTKERFDLARWTRDVVTSHESQFRRHGIAWSVQVEPKGGPKTLSVKAVRGMMVQVLENLLSNSVYWLKQEKMAHPDFRPEVRVVVDTAAREIRVTDNGPGVAPAVAEDIFRPFVTTKPPHLGKGLGLYIAREIATYHKGDLALDPRPTVHENRLNTFVFSLGDAAR